LSVRASVAIRPDQFERPSDSTFTTRRGRVSETSAGSIRADQQRKQPQFGGQAVGGQRGPLIAAQHDVGKNSPSRSGTMNRHLAAHRRFQPGGCCECLEHGVTHASAGMNAEIANRTPMPAAKTAAMTRLNRMKPLAEGT